MSYEWSGTLFPTKHAAIVAACASYIANAVDADSLTIHDSRRVAREMIADGWFVPADSVQVAGLGGSPATAWEISDAMGVAIMERNGLPQAAE